MNYNYIKFGPILINPCRVHIINKISNYVLFTRYMLSNNIQLMTSPIVTTINGFENRDNNNYYESILKVLQS